MEDEERRSEFELASTSRRDFENAVINWNFYRGGVNSANKVNRKRAGKGELLGDQFDFFPSAFENADNSYVRDTT